MLFSAWKSATNNGFRKLLPIETLEKEIIVFDIAGEYQFMDEALIESIKMSVGTYLKAPF